MFGICSFGGFLKWFVPKNGWFVLEKPIHNRWLGGNPISGNLHLQGFAQCECESGSKPRVANDYAQLRAQQELSKLFKVHPSFLRFHPISFIPRCFGQPENHRKPNKAWTTKKLSPAGTWPPSSAPMDAVPMSQWPHARRRRRSAKCRTRLAPDCWDTERKGYPLEAGHLSQPCPTRCTDSANNPWYMASNDWRMILNDSMIKSEATARTHIRPVSYQL